MKKLINVCSVVLMLSLLIAMQPSFAKSSICKRKCTITEGKKVQLIKKKIAKKSKLTSSNKSIALIKKNGVLLAKKAGGAYIGSIYGTIASVEDSPEGKKVTLTVTDVTSVPESIGKSASGKNLTLLLKGSVYKKIENLNSTNESADISSQMKVGDTMYLGTFVYYSMLKNIFPMHLVFDATGKCENTLTGKCYLVCKE